MSAPNRPKKGGGKAPLPTVSDDPARDELVAGAFVGFLENMSRKHKMTKDEVAAIVFMRFFDDE